MADASHIWSRWMDVEGPLVGSSGLLHPILETMSCRINGQDSHLSALQVASPEGCSYDLRGRPRRRAGRNSGRPAANLLAGRLRCVVGKGASFAVSHLTFLLRPHVGECARQPRDGEAGRGCGVHDCGYDPGRHKGEGREVADVAFDLAFAGGDLGK